MVNDINKEIKRIKKRARLVFESIKKGKIRIKTHDFQIAFLYDIENTYIRAYYDEKSDSVDCVLTTGYDQVDIYKEDGTEVGELPLWLVAMIETEIEKKFDTFNLIFQFRYNSDGGKKNLIKEKN